MTTKTSIAADFPCYTGMGDACTYRMYEDLLDRLAAQIGMAHARVAFGVIGADAETQSVTQMLSACLRAYGDGLHANRVQTPPRGTHSRRVGN